jgi:hypothetical protein
MEPLAKTPPRAAAPHGGRRAFLLGGVATGAALVLRRGSLPGALAQAQAHPHGSDFDVRRAAELAQLCSPDNVAGVGLRGQYFAQDQCRGKPLLVRTDAAVDFDPSLAWPQRLPRPRSARWDGWIRPVMAGPYRFHLDVPHSEIEVAHQSLVGENADPRRPIELLAGRFYPIRLAVNKLPSDGRLRLEWTAPHGARFLVPRALLYMPTETA